MLGSRGPERVSLAAWQLEGEEEGQASIKLETPSPGSWGKKNIQNHEMIRNPQRWGYPKNIHQRLLTITLW